LQWQGSVTHVDQSVSRLCHVTHQQEKYAQCNEHTLKGSTPLQLLWSELKKVSFTARMFPEVATQQ